MLLILWNGVVTMEFLNRFLVGDWKWFKWQQCHKKLVLNGSRNPCNAEAGRHLENMPGGNRQRENQCRNSTWGQTNVLMNPPLSSWTDVFLCPTWGLDRARSGEHINDDHLEDLATGRVSHWRVDCPSPHPLVHCAPASSRATGRWVWGECMALNISAKCNLIHTCKRTHTASHSEKVLM